MFFGRGGSGKSTLALQVAIRSRVRVLYATSEEYTTRLSERATRLGISDDHTVSCVSTDNVTAITKHAQGLRAELIVVDSWNRFVDPEIALLPGKIGQMRAVYRSVMRAAERLNCAVIFVGHADSSGGFAAHPSVVHDLDSSLIQIKRKIGSAQRTLRVVKSRTCADAEVNVVMTASGLASITTTQPESPPPKKRRLTLVASAQRSRST